MRISPIIILNDASFILNGALEKSWAASLNYNKANKIAEEIKAKER